MMRFVRSQTPMRFGQHSVHISSRSSWQACLRCFSAVMKSILTVFRAPAKLCCLASSGAAGCGQEVIVRCPALGLWRL